MCSALLPFCKEIESPPVQETKKLWTNRVVVKKLLQSDNYCETIEHVGVQNI